MPFSETIAAPATPHGQSALALVRASGPLVPVLSAVVLGHKDAPLPRHATLGSYHTLSGEILDQIVVTRFAAPASSTGEDVLEITCHGNPLLARRILEDLIARGCRLAQPGEFTRTAFLNGKLDLSQAEAVADLITASSDAAIIAARRQLDGELRRRVQEFSERIIQILAEIEAYIDFPEEDLPDEKPSGPRPALAALHDDITKLLATARQGDLLRHGASAVIAGPPNAGKSSLLNALLGHPRAIVSPEPGTTRDYIQEPILLGPYALQITDTAGLRPEPLSPVEREGIARSLKKIAEADFIIIVIDSSEVQLELPQVVLNQLKSTKAFVIENKTDLSVSKHRHSFLPTFKHFRVSCKTGFGIDAFRAALIKSIEHAYRISDEEIVLTSARHVDTLTRTADALKTALTKFGARNGKAKISPSELLASDLRQALEYLAEIPGIAAADGTPLDNEAMLDKLFKTFCIGK